MSLASDARDAVRKHPSLYDALCAGVVNYRAAADYLDLDGDPEAVAAALRRFAEELEPVETRAVETPVRMQSGVSLAADDAPDAASEDVVVSVGGTRVVRGGDLTAVHAAGGVDASACRYVLARLELTSVVVDAVGAVAGDFVVVVPRRQGATALRVVEDALASVPRAR